MDCVAVEAGEPERASNVSGGMAIAAIGAFGGAEMTVAFTACGAVNWMAAQGVIAPTLAADDTISTTEAGVVPPLLTLRTHRDDVLVDPSQAHAKTTGRKMNRSTHKGLTDSARPIVLDRDGNNVSRAEGLIFTGDEAREAPDGDLSPGGVGSDVF